MAAKYYLAGPMTGLPQFNFPMFERVSKALRAQGYDVVSPHEHDTVEVQVAALKSKDGKLDAAGKVGGRTWGQILADDVILLADGGITGIIFLPGWEASSGAKLEATVGLMKQFRFMRWDEYLAMPVLMARFSVACALHQEFTK